MFGQVLGRDKGFLVATEFSGSVSQQGPLVSRPGFQVSCSCYVATVFCFSIATEVSLLQPRRSRQEVMCCNFRVAIGLALARVSMS